VAVVLHPLEQRLDRLRPEIVVRRLGRERVGLVDEEDAVERPPDHPLGLERRCPHVLADEPAAVDLDEMPAPQQPHRPVHLRQQPGDGGLTGAGVPVEDEMLARCDLGKVVLLPARLHLEESDERAHLLLDRGEPDERVELRLQLLQRPRRLGPVETELLRDPVERRLVRCSSTQALRQLPDVLGQLLTDIAWHGSGKRTRDTHAETGERLLAWLTTWPPRKLTPTSRTGSGRRC
jgi:hypothetical protein